MLSTFQVAIPKKKVTPSTMKALVFRGPNQIGIEQVSIPKPGPGEAVIRVTLTTICGTDLHILKGEYVVRPGLVIGHEPVGVIHELGVGLTDYAVGERVLVGAITPCGQCNYCLSGDWSQCGGTIGGWKFGNTINGAQAEYLLVPNAQANLAKIPDDLTDEQVVLLADIASTGISAAESGEVRIGDTVAIFAQGPIGLCATVGAKLKGAGFIIAVESDPVRAAMARRMGADVVVDHTKTDAVEEIRRMTQGKGVDVAIEALGTQATFESALRVLRAGGTLSSLGVYSGKLSVPLEPFAAGLGDHKIITTLCPGGKERMAPADGVGASRQARSKTASDAHVFAGPNCGGLQTLFGTDGWSHQSGHPALGDCNDMALGAEAVSSIPALRPLHSAIGTAHRTFDLSREQIELGMKGSAQNPTGCGPHLFNRPPERSRYSSDHRYAVK